MTKSFTELLNAKYQVERGLPTKRPLRCVLVPVMLCGTRPRDRKSGNSNMPTQRAFDGSVPLLFPRAVAERFSGGPSISLDLLKNYS